MRNPSIPSSDLPLTTRLGDGQARLIQSTRIVTPMGILAGGLIIQDGIITKIIDRFDWLPSESIAFTKVDYGDSFILPGVIDGHVHVNQPGRTEWEGIETATKAAAAGGITTIVDMPLNSSPVTVSLEALETKRKSIAGKCWVDVGQHGGAIGALKTGAENRSLARDVEALLEAGVMGVKVFLCDSGLDEFPPVTHRELSQIMPILAKHRVPLWVHAEFVPRDWVFPSTIQNYQAWPERRSKSFESEAVVDMIALCAKYECPTHIVHLSNADAIPAIRRAKRDQQPLTIETCPHYLYFHSEAIPDNDPRYKCCPPIREIENRHRLWQWLELGEIDTIGSDHSPCPPAMKFLDSGDFARAWGGIASLQLLLPVMWTQSQKYEMPVTRLVECLSSSPAKLLGIDATKGSIEIGKCADLVIFDASSTWTVRGEDLFHRHKTTPYQGAELHGRVTQTYLRGELVFEDNQVSERPLGRQINRLADR